MLVVAPATASACSCVPAHAAEKLRQGTGAFVGVVESATTDSQFRTVTTVRVERAVKGQLPERLTFTSQFNSCSASPAVGSRVGVVLYGPPEQWAITTCGLTDPEQLVAAASLTPPTEAPPRVVAAVAGSSATDGVMLSARGAPTGYWNPQGRTLALAPCGEGVAQAIRGADGKVQVSVRYANGIDTRPSGALPVSDVAALGCTQNGRRIWVAGAAGDEMLLLSVVPTRAPAVQMRRRASAAAIVGPRAYFAHKGMVRSMPLGGGRLRATKHKGEFTSLSVRGSRVAGRLRDGRAAVLDLRSGALRTASVRGPLVWLSDTRLLGARAVLDARLRAVRPVDVAGRFLAVDDGAAYYADGAQITRLAPGARRPVAFARAPSDVVALAPIAASSSRQLKDAWHSCEESAKTPLTT